MFLPGRFPAEVAIHQLIWSAINVEQNPATPDAGIDQTICATSSTLNATAVSGGSWTVISGTGIIANPALANSAVSNLSTGINTFRWTISGGSCPDAFDEISINVDENPTAAFAGNDQTICATTATLAGNTATIGTGIWTLISGSGIINSPTSTTSSLSNLGTGANVFAWTISSGTCNPSTDQVTISVEQNPVTPNAGIDTNNLLNHSTLNATAVSNGSWTVISGSGIIANPALANSAVSNLSTGLNTFRWTISGGSCPDAFDEVSITVDENPTTAFAGDDQTICATTAALAGNTPTIGTGIWTMFLAPEPI